MWVLTVLAKITLSHKSKHHANSPSIYMTANSKDNSKKGVNSVNEDIGREKQKPAADPCANFGYVENC